MLNLRATANRIHFVSTCRRTQTLTTSGIQNHQQMFDLINQFRSKREREQKKESKWKQQHQQQQKKMRRNKSKSTITERRSTATLTLAFALALTYMQTIYFDEA